MSPQFRASMSALMVMIAAVSFVPVPVAGQAQKAGAKPKTTGDAKPGKAPRTAWGEPDLHGYWATPSSVATPLERPRADAGKEFLSGRGKSGGGEGRCGGRRQVKQSCRVT